MIAYPLRLWIFNHQSCEQWQKVGMSSSDAVKKWNLNFNYDEMSVKFANFEWFSHMYDEHDDCSMISGQECNEGKIFFFINFWNILGDLVL
jgi:hypothetical protein